MKSTQLVFSCALLLTIIVSSEISSIHGRQLRLMLNIIHDLNIMKEANNRRKIQGSSQQGMINFNNVNTVGDSKQGGVQPTPPADHKLGMKDSKADQHNIDAFRPTTPGNSPGAGHAFELITSPNSNGRHFATTGAPTNDFRPTAPGNSPGAGHSFEKISTPDDNKRHFVTLDDNDAFRPTKPGNSPGAGHAFEQISTPDDNKRPFVPLDDNVAFRPTKPGNSPGAGHAFEQISSPDDNRPFVPLDDNVAFRPIKPGNSPGAGHAFEQISTPDDKRPFVPLDDNVAFRPTKPGNSPGAGHAFEQISSPNAYDERKFATTGGKDNYGRSTTSPGHM